MRTFTAALAVLFVAVFSYQATSSPHAVNFYGPCCDKYITKRLPLDLVVEYELTDSHCSPAVIFTTIKGRLVCASLNDNWVLDIMNQLEDKKQSG
ncbi:CCL4 protein, partial [Erpornis zantholeuca]|nr:CCL4 protein [Erpornis zantholeuca]